MEGVDRISDLPDSILTHILPFLSTEEAFRDSFLSTRWRDLFTFVSNLDFEIVEKNINWRKSCNVKGFMCFVDRVLFFHTENVDKFRLKCRKKVDSGRIYGWISAAVRRGVKHIDLNITRNQVTLPYALFTCRTLVTLKLETGFDLESGFVLDVPKGVYFQNLLTLKLYKVDFLNDDSVSSLFSGCIGLQDVVISQCNMKNISIFDVSHNFLKELTISFSDRIEYLEGSLFG